MERSLLHRELREALGLADALARQEHVAGDDLAAGHLAAIRTALSSLEKDAGASHERPPAPDPRILSDLQRPLEALLLRRADFPSAFRRRMDGLVASIDRIVFAVEAPNAPVPSKPILGALPLARLVPQEAHTAFCLAASVALLGGAAVARSTAGRVSGAVLGLGAAALALGSDHPYAVKKAIPIEAYEAGILTVGAAAVAAPFVFRSLRRDARAAGIGVAVGLCAIALTLVTDFRASRGQSGSASARGPVLLSSRRPSRVRVTETQRPLEGLSASASDFRESGPLS